ncbi:thioredoxin peroxidase [Photobacterium rosenbergii]|uniref:Thioredoxin peroxidase n=1 Tax=Photobacterium rosenbergii TaxID=294936 RepID=A0A2T3NJY7_9GAMM|nr:redoxin domain-containing protein [Photobacterium rosenbergii]PSW15790.1 thioredoxin peroxidase [Photobacterium rosenbergii]
MSTKLKSGYPFPILNVEMLNSGSAVLGGSQHRARWQAIFVYRGKHCPVCARYLKELDGFYGQFHEAGIDIIAVSADSKGQSEEYAEELGVSLSLAYGLSEAQMKQLGLYISEPRSPQETDHNFPEPALFVVNELGNLHVVDISNNPFVRPEISTLLNGLVWIRDPNNHYPIRGALDY